MTEPNDEQSNPPPEPPATPLPLDYRTPPPLQRLDYATPQPSGAAAVLFFIFGFALAAVLVIFCGLAMGLAYFESTAKAYGPIAFWFGVAAVSSIGVIFVIRSKERRWFLLGFLIGGALAAMLDGICFANG